MSCELVISGWYSTDAPREYITAGDDIIRGPKFRSLWWNSVDQYMRPNHVLIVDSASPVKPDDAACTRTPFQRLELLRNPGHSQTTTAHYCGYTASALIGLEFALHNDVDMVIYVEQDVLVYGSSIIEKTKSALKRHDFVFGNDARQVQTSYWAMNRRGIRRFMEVLHAMKFSDKQIAPEQKFMYASTGWLPSPLLRLAVYTPFTPARRVGSRLYWTVLNAMRGYNFLPFGYGRLRPLNFRDDVFYFQHASIDELSEYRRLTGF